MVAAEIVVYETTLPPLLACVFVENGNGGHGKPDSEEGVRG
jgi:hypothetical protein